MQYKWVAVEWKEGGAVSDEGEEVSYPFGGSRDLECFPPLLVNGRRLRSGNRLRHNRVWDVAHESVLWGDVPKGSLVSVDCEMSGCIDCL